MPSNDTTSAKEPAVTLQQVLVARGRMRQWVRHTPLEYSPELSRRSGGEVYLKLEHLQVTGSFKVRGALSKLGELAPARRERGVVAATAGNHGVGVAYAARELGAPVRIYLPEDADPAKVEALRALGASLVPCPDYEAAHRAAIAAAGEEGLTRVSAYSDRAIIAGNGVVGVEILEDLPTAEVAVVPVGGGGLVSGVGLALKAANPATEVWGVEAANSPTFGAWRRAGEPVPVAREPSVAEGLAGFIEPETLTWPYVRRVVDRMEAVTEEELVHATGWILEHHRTVVEPSGAAAVALLLRGAKAIRMARGVRVVAVLTGRNVSTPRLMALLGYERRARRR